MILDLSIYEAAGYQFIQNNYPNILIRDALGMVLI